VSADDDVMARLGRLRPADAGVHRDDMIFAAGRASARPPRRWNWAAAGLAVTQSLTLVLLAATWRAGGVSPPAGPRAPEPQADTGGPSPPARPDPEPSPDSDLALAHGSGFDPDRLPLPAATAAAPGRPLTWQTGRSGNLD
jgi:hypothetical protein